MPLPTKAELAMENLLRVEAELQDYARSGVDNPEQQKQLADAVEAAIDEFINLSAVLRPGI
jgi:hypothetical protein